MIVISSSSSVTMTMATTTIFVRMMIMLGLYVYDGPLYCLGFTATTRSISTSTLTPQRSRSCTSASTINVATATARNRPETWTVIGISSTNESGLKMSSSSKSNTAEPRQFVQLTNPLDGIMLEDGRMTGNTDEVALSSVGSKLPASFITSWPTWVLETDGTWKKIPDETSTVSSTATKGGQLDNIGPSRHIETSMEDRIPTGHVNPSSIDELWSPIDLKRPQMRLALAAHVRQGVIRHVMPAVDVGYLSSSSNSNSSEDTTATTATTNSNNNGTKIPPIMTYRNRGMCSVPRSHTWMEFLGRYGRFKLIASTKRNGQSSNNYDDDYDEDGDKLEEEGVEEWTTILQTESTGKDIADAIERVTVALADENVPTELGDGSHIVNIILTGEDTMADGGVGDVFVEIPKAGHELRVSMVAVEDRSSKNSISDIGVSQKMIETPDDRKVREQCREVARLQVQISSTMPGSESQYLPEVYRDLYNDPLLRNPLYDKFKSRKEEKDQQQS